MRFPRRAQPEPLTVGAAALVREGGRPIPIVALACAGDRPVAALAEVAMADQLERLGRPDPAEASTPAEFVDAMVRLKRWTGWGYRQLEKHAAAAGRVLPRSTLTQALSRPTLPREELLAGFVIACGGDEAEATRWIAERRRLAAQLEPSAPRASPVIMASHRPRLRTIVMTAIATLALAATAGIAWHLSGSDAPTTLPGPTQAPAATPQCADATYRHVGNQRVQLPAYGGSADCVLSYGATGDGVKALQSALINCNNAAYVTVSGRYDQKTWDAIAFIQSATGATPADGVYRPETRSTLYWNHDGVTRECARYNGT